jgi:hypothetical protein
LLAKEGHGVDICRVVKSTNKEKSKYIVANQVRCPWNRDGIRYNVPAVSRKSAAQLFAVNSGANENVIEPRYEQFLNERPFDDFKQSYRRKLSPHQSRKVSYQSALRSGLVIVQIEDRPPNRDTLLVQRPKSATIKTEAMNDVKILSLQPPGQRTNCWAKTRELEWQGPQSLRQDAQLRILYSPRPTGG